MRKYLPPWCFCLEASQQYLIFFETFGSMRTSDYIQPDLQLKGKSHFEKFADLTERKTFKIGVIESIVPKNISSKNKTNFIRALVKMTEGISGLSKISLFTG